MTVSKKKTSNVKLKRRGFDSKYDEIVAKCLTLRIGESVICPVPKERGLTDTIYRNRLAVVMTRKVKPALQNKKQVIRLRCTENNEVAISLEKAS